MDTGEVELLAAAQRGDDEAFGKLVRPFIDPAYRLALRMLNDAAEAEDAVQDALYNAWRALPRFRGEAKFSTWLYRIVWRQCVDRSRRVKPLALDEDMVQIDQRHDPAGRFETAETRSEIEQALRRLSMPYRTVLTLFYIEDLPIKEIAEIVGLPVGTVKTHLHRARKELRKQLQPAAAADESTVQAARQGVRP